MRLVCAVGAAATVITGGLAISHAQEASAPIGACGSARLDGSLIEHVRARHLSGAHAMAELALAICSSSPLRFRWRILNALVLEGLDEPTRAQAALFDTVKDAPSPERETAAALLARSYSLSGDDTAFVRALDRLPENTAARVRAFAARDDRGQFQRVVSGLSDPTLAAGAWKYFSAYDEAMHARRPWLAGTLSAVLPGAGQAYAGSWQGAAVAFALNTVLIGATAELIVRRLYISAGATGLAASIFYVGNVLNAADLARRRNQLAASAPAEGLERLLIPEAYP